MGAIGLFHVAASPRTEGATVWRTISGKVAGFSTPFIRFDYTGDILLLACFAALVAWAVLRKRRGTWLAAQNELVFAGLFFAMYVAMPVGKGMIYDIDDRALPLAYLFLAAAAFRLAGPAITQIAAAAVALAVANAAYTGLYLHRFNEQMAGYERVMERTPAGSTVFAVHTLQRQGRLTPMMHAGSIAILKGSMTPQLFVANFGFPMPYFSYKSPGYAPSVFWYTRNEPVEWPRVMADYIIVTKPFDRSRIPASYAVVFENDTAALMSSTRPAASSE